MTTDIPGPFGLDAATSSARPATTVAAEHLLDRFEAYCGPLVSARPEVYPARQALAAAKVLAVDAVGISIILEHQKRIPLGASCSDAVTAESLEFTLGQGPCLEAHASGRPVLVPDIADHWSIAAQRWPEYANEILARTPFRAVFGFPLTAGDMSLGSVCMYRRTPSSLTPAELGEILSVTNQIFYDLVDTGTFSGAEDQDFRWLNMPLARVRTEVWQAIGTATVELNLSSTDALALIRSYCYATDQLLDSVADDIITGALPLDQLHP